MEWMALVSWVDLLIVIVVVRGTYVGSQRGFLGELFHIFGMCLAIILSTHFYTPLSNFIHSYLFLPLNIAYIIGFLLVALVLYLIFKIGYAFTQKFLKIEVLPTINKAGGAFLGFCKGFLLCIFLIFVMLLVPIGYISESAKTRSLFAPVLIKTGTVLYQKSMGVFFAVRSEDLQRILGGVEPLKFKEFRLKRKDKLDEILE